MGQWRPTRQQLDGSSANRKQRRHRVDRRRSVFDPDGLLRKRWRRHRGIVLVKFRPDKRNHSRKPALSTNFGHSTPTWFQYWQQCDTVHLARRSHRLEACGANQFRWGRTWPQLDNRSWLRCYKSNLRPNRSRQRQRFLPADLPLSQGPQDFRKVREAPKVCADLLEAAVTRLRVTSVPRRRGAKRHNSNHG